MKKLFALLTIPLLLTGIPINAHAQVQNNVAVSAIVPPSAGDYQFAFATDGQTTVSQNTTLTYHIDYGAQASAGVDTPTTLVVHFSDDIAPGGSNVVDYVIGSATSGYGDTKPVVNLTTRTITWSIPNLPAGAVNQTVSFQLKTNENYTGISPVSFSTRASMSNPYTTPPDQTAAQTYKFNAQLVTSGPTNETPTTTPTLTPTPTELQITGVSVTDISPQSATVAIATSQPSSAFIRYGTTANTLLNQTQTSPLGLYTTLTLNNLLPNTRYYFQVVVADASGKKHTSEVFTFTTAKQPPTVTTAGKNAISLTSNGILLASTLLADDENGNVLALITTNTNYQINYTYALPPSITTSEVIIRSADGKEKTVHLNTQSELVYTAALRSDGPGLYDVLVTKTDTNGNVHEQKVARLKVMLPLTVSEDGTNNPIGDARVQLYLFNPALGKYQLVPEEFFPGLHNPGFTNASGELPMLLPAGRYQAQISALGHRTANVVFTLGGEAGQEFPLVSLKKDLFDLTSLGTFLRDWFTDLFQTMSAAMLALMSSPRVFDIVAGGATAGFALLSYLLFSIRTQMKVTHLLPFLFFFVSFSRNKHKQDYISGIIRTTAKEPIGQVTIDIIDPKTKTVLMHTQTTGAGTFHIRNRFKNTVILLLLTKDGYAPEEHIIETSVKEPLFITLQHQRHHTPIVVQEVEHVAGSLFEVSLLFGLVLELMFFATFGPLKTLPFIILSLLNILLWIFYREEHAHL